MSFVWIREKAADRAQGAGLGKGGRRHRLMHTFVTRQPFRRLASLGGSAEDIEPYVRGPARTQHERIIDEAEQEPGVIGLPDHGPRANTGEFFLGAIAPTC